MKSLRDAVKYIKKEFTQKLIVSKEFDYTLNLFIEKPNPKFLFRGEKIYPTTKSKYHRLSFSDYQREELNKYILDLSFSIIKKYFGISQREDPAYWPRIFAVGSFLQHYGFPIMWLDFTEEIEVAAFFASYKNNTGKGRIWIIELKSLIENGESIFKLDNVLAKRPSIQKAYALRMFDDKPDIQNPEHFKILKLDFEVSKEDVIFFERRNLLNTESDQISEFIINYIKDNSVEDDFLNDLLIGIQKDLVDLKS